MINNLFASNKLSHDPVAWVKQLHARYRLQKMVLIATFVGVTLAVLGLALAITLITIISNAQGGTLPSWFPYATVIVSASSGLLTALLGFFIVKPRYEEAHRNARYIASELLLFEAKTRDYSASKNAPLLLATNVATQIKFGQGELV